MDVTIEVKRFNPEETESSSYNQNYSLDVPEHFTVLDGLIKVREEVDESLALRCSCRAARLSVRTLTAAARSRAQLRAKFIFSARSCARFFLI